jgi:hypothetical protein
VAVLTSPPLSQWNLPQNIFDLLNFEAITGIRGGPTATSRFVVFGPIAINKKLTKNCQLIIVKMLIKQKLYI